CVRAACSANPVIKLVPPRRPDRLATSANRVNSRWVARVARSSSRIHGRVSASSTTVSSSSVATRHTPIVFGSYHQTGASTPAADSSAPAGFELCVSSAPPWERSRPPATAAASCLSGACWRSAPPKSPRECHREADRAGLPPAHTLPTPSTHGQACAPTSRAPCTRGEQLDGRGRAGGGFGEILNLLLHRALAHPAELKNRVPQTQDRRGALLPERLHISLGEDPLTLLVDHTPGNALDRDLANLVEPFGLVGLQHRRLDQRPLHSRQRPHPHRATPFGAFHVTGFEVAGTENLVATKKSH